MRPVLALAPSSLVLGSLSLVLGLACQRLPADDDGGGGGGGGPSTPEPTDGETFLPADDDPTRGADDANDTEGIAGCDPVAQLGCPAGQKCTAIVSNQAIDYACVPVTGGLGPLESCTASPSDGIDDCPAGFACLADAAAAGLCAPLCGGNSDCTQALCMPARETAIPYCADDCSPFESPCPSPLECRRNADRFSCLFLGLADVGGPGAVCAVTGDAGCAPGLACLPGALVPGCSTDNCCSILCDTTDPDPCASPASCLPLLESPAPGFESIGACYVPA
jgi:hypothetical protein